jgi:hypothetical protein
MNRLDQSIKAMAERFPKFAYSETTVAGVRQGRWVGDLQPIATPDVPWDLLADLQSNRPVFVLDGGTVVHLDGCNASHLQLDLPLQPVDLHVNFCLEAVYNGTTALPLCRILSPVIPLKKMNHVWGNGAMCAFIASDFDWMRETVADCMNHHAIWLVKQIVFLKTGTWLGSQHINDPAYHLSILKPNDKCWCGSGHRYKRCHRPEEEAQMFNRRAISRALLNSR